VRKPSHFPTPLEVVLDTANYMVAAEVGDELSGVHATRTAPDTVDLSVYGRLLARRRHRFAAYQAMCAMTKRGHAS
jgi:hypothetical protein